MSDIYFIKPDMFYLRFVYLLFLLTHLVSHYLVIGDALVCSRLGHTVCSRLGHTVCFRLGQTLCEYPPEFINMY